MIQINDCKITQQGKYLTVLAQIEPYTYFDDVIIHKVYIDTDTTFDITGPSSKAIVYTVDAKTAYITMDTDSLTNKLFFIWIEASGTPSDDTPCDMKDNLILTYAFDNTMLYQKGSCLIKNLKGCIPSAAMIDFIIQSNALKIALNIGEYSTAIKMWQKLMGTQISKAPDNVRGCGCHG